MELRDKKILADKIIKVIIDDISDRSGLQNEWDEIDEDIQKEIKDEWQRKIMLLIPNGKDK